MEKNLTQHTALQRALRVFRKRELDPAYAAAAGNPDFIEEMLAINAEFEITLLDGLDEDC
jgi:hypothetical protein